MAACVEMGRGGQGKGAEVEWSGFLARVGEG